MVLTKHSSLLFVKKEDDNNLPWYQSHDLWSNLMTKTLDKTYKSRLNFLDSHPLITKKMRSVLFDWLIEVKIFYFKFKLKKIFIFLRFVKFINFIMKLIIWLLLILINIYVIQIILQKINFNYLVLHHFLLQQKLKYIKKIIIFLTENFVFIGNLSTTFS